MVATHVVLNSGRQMPIVGLGCWMGAPGGEAVVETMVSDALELGYRHIDTASFYGNEEHVGRAIKRSKVPRSEIFITTKLANSMHGHVREALEGSLKALDCEYIDLYLMHWPIASTSEGVALQPGESPTYVETWAEMEKLLETGKVKSIGVSNFSIKTFDVLLPQVKIIPAVNQVQLHPCLPQYDLVAYTNARGIHTTAYTPLGAQNSPFYTDPDFLKIAEKHKVSVAQVVLSWNVNRGVSVIPKTQNRQRMVANSELIDLDDEDVELINNFHKKPGQHRQLFDSSVIDKVKVGVFGWTFEQLGMNLDSRGYVIE